MIRRYVFDSKLVVYAGSGTEAVARLKASSHGRALLEGEAEVTIQIEPLEQAQVVITAGRWK